MGLIRGNFVNLHNLVFYGSKNLCKSVYFEIQMISRKNKSIFDQDLKCKRFSCQYAARDNKTEF